MNREELLKNAKPILFSTPMVQAILDGRKTVTRRVVKPQPKLHSPLELKCDGFEQREHEIGTNKWNEVQHNYLGEKFYSYGRTAPYKTGDILYVRETWQAVGTIYKFPAYYIYKASPEACPKTCPYSDGEKWIDLGQTWKPSIHMPKEAARIFLKVIDVRVERLQFITVDGIEHEGICLTYPLIKLIDSEHLKKFIEIWNSTIKKQDIDKYGWEANPWVWVIEFERVEREI